MKNLLLFLFIFPVLGISQQNDEEPMFLDENPVSSKSDIDNRPKPKDILQNLLDDIHIVSLNSNQKILYKDVPNYIYIDEIGPEKYGGPRIEVWGGKVKRIGKGLYSVEVTGDYLKKAELVVNKNPLKKYKYKILSLPNPIPLISNHRGGNITKQQFDKFKSLNVKLEGFPFEVEWIIESFNLVKISKGKKAIFQNTGSQFNADILKEIQSCNKEDIYIFDKIQVSYRDLNKKKTNSRIINNLTFFIE